MRLWQQALKPRFQTHTKLRPQRPPNQPVLIPTYVRFAHFLCRPIQSRPNPLQYYNRPLNCSSDALDQWQPSPLLNNHNHYYQSLLILRPPCPTSNRNAITHVLNTTFLPRPATSILTLALLPPTHPPFHLSSKYSRPLIRPSLLQLIRILQP